MPHVSEADAQPELIGLAERLGAFPSAVFPLIECIQIPELAAPCNLEVGFEKTGKKPVYVILLSSSKNGQFHTGFPDVNI